MDPSSRGHKAMYSVLGVIVLTTILSAFAACEEPTPIMGGPEWRTKIAEVQLPTKGCFTATYPSLQWRAIACTTPPKLPYPPAQRPYPPANGGPGPFDVGNGNDYSAEVSNLISSAVGSFPTVSNVTSESGQVGGTGPLVANTYSLQLNTKFFTTSVCTGHGSTCQGWQQFIYSSSSQQIFIQYWLLNYSGTCPTGWNSAFGDCWENGPNGAPVPTQPITNLANLSLTGTATAGGTDSVTMTYGGSASAANQDSILNLASAWQGVEFTIVGDCCYSQAVFNANATIDVETTVHHGSTAAPTCMYEGFTGETNNLNLVGTQPFATLPPAPALKSEQNNLIPGTTASCAAADGIGDTHLQTFSGLFYDFQATGDFLLAQTQNFQVQTRQISGAPNWPNAALNQAVATQMGNTRVALCAAGPAPVVIDGSPKDLPDGQTLALPSGVNIYRAGNVYLVMDRSGNSLRAVMNDTPTAQWINATVGLGTWPTPVRGLLANPNGNVNQLAASDGTVFNTPVSFADLYGPYGDSWRVAPATSLLSDCGGGAKELGNPTQFFFARDLAAKAPSAYATARAICTNVGVKEPTLLDACTLDVAVLGDKEAAAVYVGAPAPVAVGEAGQGKSGQG